MNDVAQVGAGAPVVVAAQLANCASLPAEAAQAAIASALSSSCEAFRSCTSSALASTEKPSTVGSLNTVATGAASAVSPKMVWMLAANSGAVSRQSLRGPGALLVHGSGVRQRARRLYDAGARRSRRAAALIARGAGAARPPVPGPLELRCLDRSSLRCRGRSNLRCRGRSSLRSRRNRIRSYRPRP